MKTQGLHDINNNNNKESQEEYAKLVLSTHVNCAAYLFSGGFFWNVAAGRVSTQLCLMAN